MESIKRKVVLITGSSSGIGRSAAIELSKYGCWLVLNGRNIERLNEVAEKCTNEGNSDTQVLVIPGDDREKKILEDLIKQTISHYGKLDVLVNNVGKLATSGGLLSGTWETFDDIIQTNLKSAYWLTKLAVPHLIKTKGCIINISSKLGSNCSGNHIIYGMTKAAMNLLTKTSAAELGKHHIRVNAICPGIIQTRIFETSGFPTNHMDEFYGSMGKLYPLGHVGITDDVSNLLVFLASDASAFITGALIPIDGGSLVQLPSSFIF